jgi:hypothetical protein
VYNETCRWQPMPCCSGAFCPPDSGRDSDEERLRRLQSSIDSDEQELQPWDLLRHTLKIRNRQELPLALEKKTFVSPSNIRLLRLGASIQHGAPNLRGRKPVLDTTNDQRPIVIVQRLRALRSAAIRIAPMSTKRLIRSTTVLSIRRNGSVVLADDGPPQPNIRSTVFIGKKRRFG